MANITRVQKEYLEDRVRVIRRQKEAELYKKYPVDIDREELFRLVEAKKIKLAKNIYQLYKEGRLEYGYRFDPKVLFDLSEYEPIWEENAKKIKQSMDKIEKMCQKIVDKYVLTGTGVEDLIKELMEFEG